jgi:1-phosphofructokinase family hexose kinase
LAVAGGKGVHVAQVCSALGARTTLAGILAGHSGRWIAEELGRDGVRGRFAWTSGETRTCVSIADGSSGLLTELYESGGKVSARAWEELLEIVAAELRAARWLVLSGSLPPGSPEHGYGQLLALAGSTGVDAAVDSRGSSLAAALSGRPALVKINAAEAGELLGREIADAPEASEAASELRTRAGGSAVVVITLGAAGAVLVDPQGVCWRATLPARDRVARFAVGSGDAFLAGLLVGRCEQLAWCDTLALAAAAGTSNAELPGAGRIDAVRTRELAARVHVAAI